MTTAYKVLVAEDNPALSAVLRFNLQNAGYEVTAARNGREALENAKTTDFDIVISDQQMPLMCGTELIEQLREIDAYQATPIVMLTAKAMELDETDLKGRLGVDRLISKPFSPAAIVETVEQMLTMVSS